MIINGLHNRQKEIINGILNSDAKYFVCNSSRQFGKTTMLSYLSVILAMTVENENIMVVTPTYSQSQILYTKIINIKNIDQVISSKKSSKPYEIKFKSNTTIHFKSGDNPDSLRGGSYIYVIIDEAAFLKEGLFDTIIRPTTAAKKNSKIILSSTPNGKNQFYELAEIAQSGNDNYEYYFSLYSDNPYYDLNEIEDARKSLPDDVFDQEYLGIFNDGGGKVFNIQFKTVDSYTDICDTAYKYYAGIDWGRIQDSTVLTIMDSKGDTVLIKKWTGQSWESMQTEIAYYLHIFKPIAYAEKNGIGDPLNSDMRKKYSNVHDFVTSAQSKKEIIEKLRYDMVQENISLPSIKLEPELYTEFANYTYHINKTGIISYHHKEGNFHDDIIDSIAIANFARNQHNKAFFAKVTPNPFYT